MRISAIRRETSDDGESLAATVSWEDTDRPDQEIFFRVPPGFGEAFPACGDAFMLAAAIPAAIGRERRLRMAGAVCPRLRDGIVAIRRLLRGWFGDRIGTPVLEAEGGFRSPATPPAPRAAVFLSGGIDSLFALAANREDFPVGHPAAFRDAIFVNGFAFYPRDEAQAADVRLRSRRSVERIAGWAGIDVIEVETNLRELEPDFDRFARWFALVLAAVAHALGGRIGSAAAAADLDAAHLRAWGAHPLLYRLASSASVTLSDFGGHLSRLGRTRFLARCGAPLENVCVCLQGPLPAGTLNCGRCEKCLRTLLAFIAAGVPESRRSAFPRPDVDAAAIAAIRPGHVAFTIPYFWREIAAALPAAGRGDLARAADRLLRDAEEFERRVAGVGWRGYARRLDRRFFGGALRRTRRAMRTLRNADTR